MHNATTTGKIHVIHEDDCERNDALTNRAGFTHLKQPSKPLRTESKSFDKDFPTWGSQSSQASSGNKCTNYMQQ